MQVKIRRRYEPVRTCAVKTRAGRCDTPLVVIAGRNVHFAGRHGLGLTEDGQEVIRGWCPACGQRYEVVNPAQYVPARQ